MAASQTQICNLAISYLGGNQIININDVDSTEAELCRANYDFVRDAVLEEVNWTFATKRYKYTSTIATPPTFGYANSYPVAPEVLRIFDVQVVGSDWAYEGGHILTDAGEVQFKAVVQVTTEGSFSPSFVQAFASRLAAEIALPLTNSTSQHQRMVEMYMAKKKWAQASDGRQSQSRRRVMSDIIR